MYMLHCCNTETTRTETSRYSVVFRAWPVYFILSLFGEGGGVKQTECIVDYILSSFHFTPKQTG